MSGMPFRFPHGAHHGQNPITMRTRARSPNWSTNLHLREDTEHSNRRSTATYAGQHPLQSSRANMRSRLITEIEAVR